MNLNPQQILRQLTTKLTQIYEQREAHHLAIWLLEFVTKATRSEVITHSFELTDDQYLQLDSFCKRLLQHEPIQYVLGEAYCFGFKFKVDQNVLIPRPETEELIQHVVDHCKTLSKPCCILDIGTGSGCIAISVKLSVAHCNVHAIDISQDALKVAQLNDQQLGAGVQFNCQDVLTAPLDISYDVIVSNPPYVMEQEKQFMHQNVLDYEPALALFVPDDHPLKYYQKIVTQAFNGLKSGGVLFFEINEVFGQQVVELFPENHFKQVHCLQDLAGKDRFVVGYRL